MDYSCRIQLLFLTTGLLLDRPEQNRMDRVFVDTCTPTWYTQARHVALMQFPLDPRCHVDADVACQGEWGIQKPPEVWHGVHHAN